MKRYGCRANDAFRVYLWGNREHMKGVAQAMAEGQSTPTRPRDNRKVGAFEDELTELELDEELARKEDALKEIAEMASPEIVSP